MKQSELILNKDGSIYHLNLHPEEIADTIITVGDQDRVGKVSRYFDKITVQKQHREFVTHTGELNGKRLTVISTGIGTDNIDIVLNELDALVNIDFKTRQAKEALTRLTFIRIGTSGIIREDVPLDSFLVSKHAVGLDSLMYFYKNYQQHQNTLLDKKLKEVIQPLHLNLYTTNASIHLLKQLPKDTFLEGITLTCNGFYAPQLRQLRLPAQFHGLFERFDQLEYEGLRMTNMEMETAGIYGLAAMLGHDAISLNALLANRRTGTFSKNPQAVIEQLIEKTLDIISNNF